MIWRYSPYLLPLLATSILCAAFVVVIWPLRRAPGARALGALLAVAGLWALGEFIQYGLQPFEPKLFMDTLAYVWVGLAPVLWLVFCLQYTRIRGHMRGSEIASLLIVPAIAAISAATSRRCESTSSASSPSGRRAASARPSFPSAPAAASPRPSCWPAPSVTWRRCSPC